MKKICVITSSRADYGLLKHLLKEIKVSPLLHLQLIVCGSHLSSFHGMTINEIIDDGFKIDEKVDITQKNDTQLDISISISSGIKSFASIYASLNPDAVLILGDRYEILAAAILLIISFVVNIHVYNSSKKNQPPNKSIMKMATMSGRSLILVVFVAAAIAFN